MTCLVFMDWVVTQAEWEGYCNHLGRRGRDWHCRNWASAYFLTFYSWSQTGCGACRCIIQHILIYYMDFPGGSYCKASSCNAGDLGPIPGSGVSPGEGNGNPLQYSCLENPMDREAWQTTVHGITKSRTRLSDFTSLHMNYVCLWISISQQLRA